MFLTDAFKQGLFEVQDASSQLVAAFLDVQPGMRVVDTCAGAGGKTLHMASLMQNKGQLIAMDLYESKLKQLKSKKHIQVIELMNKLKNKEILIQNLLI